MKRALFLLGPLVLGTSLLAQPRPQTSPGVGNAVLLATHSIQIDRDTRVVSGDVIVNDSATAPFLGELALSLDRSVTTAAGYKLAATSVDLDQGAVAGGDVYYNTLSNLGTIAGAQFTPLALPVFATLPPVLIRLAGPDNVSVPNNGSVILEEGSYGALTIGNNAIVHLRGGGYSFASITIGNNGALRYGAASDLVVAGRVNFGPNAVVAPESGSGLAGSSMRMQVDGINGTSGAMNATPAAVHVDEHATVIANIHSTAGTIVLDQDVEGSGAFIARDIRVGRGARLSVSSAFNAPPTANAQSVVTTGTSPLAITLTGSNPEGAPLTFSIVAGPTAGTLTTPVQASPSSATVTYTPSAANVPDSFTFRVTDPGGATGDAVVTINASPEDPAPPNPTTVIATDSSAQTSKDVPATLLLRGTAPAGVALTFSVVSGTGPFHGSLGAVTQGTEVPQRSATVVYTPDAGFTGLDSFQFKACGVIASITVCDNALFSINVQTGPDTPGVIAHDVEVSTPAETDVVLSLGETSIAGAGHHLALKPLAAMLDSVEIAGNVADANNDGVGDNANALPGSTPVFMSAGVGQSGGAGSNGTVRMQFEWDLSGLGSTNGLQSAAVVLPTHRGTSDSLDTSFYWVAASGDGNLTNSDFQSPVEAIGGAVMPVPPSMAVGDDGTFSFSVLAELRAAVNNGYSFFAVQGRVNESAAGPARGLEVRTTASGNVSGNNVPMLSLATPGVVAPLLYRITSLPVGGVLRDSLNNLITSVPFNLPNPQVTFAPNVGFLGLATFAFDVSDGFTVAAATGRINVIALDCRTSVAGCNNGR